MTENTSINPKWDDTWGKIDFNRPDEELRKLVIGMIKFGHADPNETYGDITPLRQALLKGKDATAAELIKYGADINANKGHAMFPIHIAAQKGCWEAIDEMIKRGVDINTTTQSGQTPMHLALRFVSYDDLACTEADNIKRQKLLEGLVARGADIDAINIDGKTPMDYCSPKEREFAKQLAEKIQKDNEEKAKIEKNKEAPSTSSTGKRETYELTEKTLKANDINITIRNNKFGGR